MAGLGGEGVELRDLGGAARVVAEEPCQAAVGLVVELGAAVEDLRQVFEGQGVGGRRNVGHRSPPISPDFGDQPEGQVSRRFRLR